MNSDTSNTKDSKKDTDRQTAAGVNEGFHPSTATVAAEDPKQKFHQDTATVAPPSRAKEK